MADRCADTDRQVWCGVVWCGVYWSVFLSVCACVWVLDGMQAGEVDATMLALAGLKRMSMEGEATSIVDKDDVLPAVAQGAIGIQVKTYKGAFHPEGHTLATNVCCIRSFPCVCFKPVSE